MLQKCRLFVGLEANDLASLCMCDEIQKETANEFDYISSPSTAPSMCLSLSRFLHAIPTYCHLSLRLTNVGSWAVSLTAGEYSLNLLSAQAIKLPL